MSWWRPVWKSDVLKEEVVQAGYASGREVGRATPFALGTAPKVAWRALQASQAKFLFVVLAVAVGVAALSGVKGFGYAFQGMLLRNAKQLIAADLQAQIWNFPTDEEIRQTGRIGSEYGTMTRVTETVSMSASAHQRIPQMVSVKSVDPTVYPFYGDFKVSPDFEQRFFGGCYTRVTHAIEGCTGRYDSAWRQGLSYRRYACFRA